MSQPIASLERSFQPHAETKTTPHLFEVRRYRDNIFRQLHGNRWSKEVASTETKARLLLRRERRAELAPSWICATQATAKTLFFTATPLILADQLWRWGLGWAVPPLLLIAGVGFYGAVAILHDLLHDSFSPSKRVNALFGTVLAPLLLLDFESFKTSHLTHHRNVQSPSDPKRFGAEQNDDARLPEYRTIEHVPPLVRPFLMLGASVARLPLRLRHLAFLTLGMAFLGPVLLIFGGDFSLFGRDWRRPSNWLALLVSTCWVTALYAVSPSLLALWGIALLIGYSWTFSVFAGHVTPNQVYWLEPRPTSVGDSLNVSNIHIGWLGRWLGHGFSDNHSTHHISTWIPGYHLNAATKLIASEVAPFQAPPINLLKAEDCSLIFASLYLSFTLPTREIWDIQEDAALRKVRPDKG